VSAFKKLSQLPIFLLISGNNEKNQRGYTPAFTVIELVCTITLLLLLTTLLVWSLPPIQKAADRAAMVTTMQRFGQAIFSYSSDHGGRFPGPLWPGQVAEYDRNRGGRLVVLLAPYLGIPDRTNPYVVERLMTRSLRQATRSIPPQNVRLFVMNMSVPTESGTVNPWGREQNNPQQSTPPLLLSQLPGNARSLTAMSEADQSHPDVKNAPWASNTPQKPAHGNPRLTLKFDGRVTPEK